MSWGEAIRLTRLLSLDPGSAVGAAVAEFDRPTHRDALVLMDLYDMLNSRGAKRRPPKYPRPWGDKSKRRIGRARLDRTQLRSLLDAHRTDHIEEG